MLLNQVDIQSVRTQRNHPQTNGKIERMNGSVKHDALFPNAPQSYSEASVDKMKSWQLVNKMLGSLVLFESRLIASIRRKKPLTFLNLFIQIC